MNNIYYMRGGSIPKDIRAYTTNANNSKREALDFITKSILEYPITYSNKTPQKYNFGNSFSDIEYIYPDTSTARAGTTNNYSVSFGGPRKAIIHSFSNRIISH